MMPEAQKAGSRIAWLDLGKGWAMALVLLGHSMRDDMRTASPALDLIYRMVYIFHMTAFFWMSGYTYRLSRDRGSTPMRVLSRRLRKQVVPWGLYTLLIWTVFSLAVRLPGIGKALTEAGYAAVSLKDYLLSALQANNPFAYHLWFLLVLMLLTAVVGLTDAAAGGNHLKPVCWALTALGLAGLALREALSLGEWWRLFDYVTLYLPIFCLGILMADVEVSDLLCWIWGALGIIYIVVRAVFFSGFSGNSVQAPFPAARVLIYALADLLLPGVLLMMRKLFSQGIWPRTGIARRLLTYLGRESMLIYLLHQPFCRAFLGMVLYGRRGVPALPTMAVCIAASLAVPWAVDKAWHRLRAHF